MTEVGVQMPLSDQWFQFTDRQLLAVDSKAVQKACPKIIDFFFFNFIFFFLNSGLTFVEKISFFFRLCAPEGEKDGWAYRAMTTGI